MILFKLSILLCGLQLSCTFADKLKVGVIGGGIGGSATAYHLRLLLKDNVDITLFESNAIGGRLSSRTIGSKRYEAGGAILIPRNRYIGQLVDRLGLKHRTSELTGYSALYDGKQVLFAESEWKLASIMKLVWRYGFGLYYLNSHIDQMLDSFDRIYSLQDSLNGFENVTSLLMAMDPSLAKDMHVSSKDGFKRDGFSSVVVEELVAATLRVNYGQHLKAHKFVGSVSVAGAGGGLWAVEGGNERVPQRLVEESGAKVVMRAVTRVVRHHSGRFAVVPASRSDIPPENEDFEFDAVVIAAPQTDDMPHRISFQGFEKPPSFSGRYHRTVSTLLRGALRTDQFPGVFPYTDEILTTQPGGLFNSIGRVYPVDSEPPVNGSDIWKVFSQRPLTAKELSFLFHGVKDVNVVDWLAYPEYGTEAREDRFVLAPGLYHVNAIEWAASAMEMSLVGARNVAILARNAWCATRTCPDQEPVPQTPHVEL